MNRLIFVISIVMVIGGFIALNSHSGWGIVIGLVAFPIGYVLLMIAVCRSKRLAYLDSNITRTYQRGFEETFRRIRRGEKREYETW
jgi:hypothetical protein